MRHIVLLIIVLAALAGFVNLWARASRERRDVLARLDRERSLRPDYSPTADLFREVGAPPVDVEGLAPTAFSADGAPPAPAETSPAPTPSSAPTELPAAIPTVFEALHLPMDFVPMEPGTSQRAVYAVERSAASVREELFATMQSLDLTAVWHEPTVATVARGTTTGLLTIYPQAGTARNLDGTLLFPTARADETVVRFIAT